MKEMDYETWKEERELFHHISMVVGDYQQHAMLYQQALAVSCLITAAQKHWDMLESNYPEYVAKAQEFGE